MFLTGALPQTESLTFNLWIVAHLTGHHYSMYFSADAFVEAKLQILDRKKLYCMHCQIKVPQMPPAFITGGPLTATGG